MRPHSHNWYRFRIAWLILLVLIVCGCAPAEGQAKSVSLQTLVSQVKQPLQSKAAIELAYEKILTGDFEGTADIIEKSSATGENEIFQQLAMIVDEYKAVKASRDVFKEKSYKERKEELDKLLAKGQPKDINDIDEAFLAVIKVAESSTEEQKKVLLKSPFVKQLIVSATQKGREFESQGKWADAYAHCYYWLGNLDRDNDEYKDRSEQLIEKAMMEISLKDNTCETSAERHEGIKPEMLTGAIRSLDFNYVSTVNYAEMAKKAIERCQLLGLVLAGSTEELAYKTDAKKIKKWSAGLNAIQEELHGPFAAATKNKFLKIFDEVLALNTITLEIPSEVIVAQFSEAALKALDPYTSLYWPWQIRDLQKSLTQQFTGVGIHITKVRGVLTVASLLLGTPAYFSGLDAEDSILAINGEKTDGMTLQCAVSKITGSAGTKVTLTIKHSGEEKTEDIIITRAKIIVPTVRGWLRLDDGGWQYMIDPANGIGYVRITGFTDTTVPGVKEALKQLKSKELKGLIIDLRNNTGGYLVASATIVDMFISEEGGLIVKSQPKWGGSTYKTAHRKGTESNYPIVVLTNKISASASEIVAGALQDTKYKRATIVGERSYGKGSVQTLVSVSRNGSSQLKYTMAYYHLPSNQRVKNRYVLEKEDRKDWGIAPDVEVELRNDEMINKTELQWANDILAKADHDSATRPVKRYSRQEIIKSDTQLAVGLLVVKTKIIQAGGKIFFETPADPNTTLKLPSDS